MLYVDGLASSHVDLKNPANLWMDYQARMAVALDALRPGKGDTVDVIHLGGGALALARYVAATRPAARQEVWEIEPELVALGRMRLGGRKLGLRCGDAAQLIHRCVRADVVIGDAFVGTELPEAMASAAFADEVARVLGDRGLYLLNVVDEPPFQRAAQQRRLLRERFASVLQFGDRAVVSGRRAGNVLLAASSGPLSRERLRRALAGGRFPGLVQ